jgi:multidrug efflux pump subunit AcrA (membrane-fusion protein)
MKRKIIIGSIVLILIVVVWQLTKTQSSTDFIEVEVSVGEFEISVTTNGELDAKSSTIIYGPKARSIGIWEELKIESLIDEGTIVDSGQFIASIDQTPLLTKLKEINSNLEQFTTKISKSKIDSALELRSARDNLTNLKYNIEEQKIELLNSKYEAPAVQRKIQISMEKAQRSYDQALDNYVLKKEKQVNNVRTAVIEYQKELEKQKRMLGVLEQFRIYAPQSGMLIYHNSWRGKIKTGSNISAWEPIVAKLPDLSSMIVKTFVNEIDISKIKVGQEVIITVDAFPDKKLHGVVKTVANIGQEIESASAHVFEVIIDVTGMDDDLRPAMTTKNQIVTNTLDSVMYVPLECLHTEDSLTYVYSGSKKVIVETGERNDDYIVITKGLSQSDRVYLTPPESATNWSFKN